MVERAFAVNVRPHAEAELEALRVFEHRRVVDAIRENLRYGPNVESRKRKRLNGLIPGFEHERPIWELKVGALRVFYDVNEVEHKVIVRAVRRKLPGQTTEDVTR